MMSSLSTENADLEIEEHPDQRVEENLTVLQVHRNKMQSALQAKDMKNIEHFLALIEDKLNALSSVEVESLTELVRNRLSSEVAAAKAEWQSTETMVEFARGLSAPPPPPNPGPSSAPCDAHTRVQWKWTPLPFHGRKGEWLSWWQTFSSAIHNAAGLGDEWKMKALMECLRGEAADVLGNLEKVAQNYPRAIELLETRYGDPMVLSKAYYEQLEKLPASTSLKSGRQTLDKLMAIVRNLESLKEKIKIDERFVAEQIVSKFQADFLRWPIHDLEKVQPDMNFSPTQLLEAIERKMKADTYIATMQAADKDEPSTEAKSCGVLVAGSSGVKRPRTEDRPKTCVYCSNTHVSSECRRFGSVMSRRNRLTELKKCFNCLMSFHDATKCRKPPAKCAICKKTHNTALCMEPLSRKPKQGKINIIRFSDSYLQTFICVVQNAKTGKSFEIRGLLDTGSQSSFICFDLIKKLSLPLGNKILLDCLRFADSEASKINGYYVVVTLRNFENQVETVELITTPCIVGDMKTCPPPDESLSILPTDLNYADYDIFKNDQRPIKILLGADLFHTFVHVKTSKELGCGVNLLDSFFGWIPSGGINYEPPIKRKRATLLAAKSTQLSLSSFSDIRTFPAFDFIHFNESFIENLHLEYMWKLESLGIESPDKEVEKGFEYSLDLYKNTTYVDELGRKNIRLPWKDLKINLPSNFRVALARLKHLVSNTPPDVLKIGDDHFKQQQAEGIIEDAPPIPKNGPGSVSGNRHIIHYMPHRWLFQKGKLRVVYDASAPTKAGVSLNSMIYQGCNLTTNIVRLLLNFRMNKIGLTSDIEKAFLQISLNEVDRDSSRFLWLKDITKPVTFDNLAYKRFARLPMGLNVSPYILTMVLTDVFNEPPYNSWLKDGQNRFYADNLVTSVSSQTDAVNLFEAMTGRLSKIKMNLRDWASNDPIVTSALPADKLDQKVGPISILGMPWDRVKDIMTIKLDDEKPLQGTKRNVLKFMASIFDPLGLIAPSVVDLKLFIQKCWKQKYEWNTILPPDLEAEWLKLRTDALQIPTIEIQRHYFPNSGNGTYDLHIFCDASIKAYACCAYLVYSDRQSFQFHSRLIFSKIKISPPSGLTIPKLELMGVLIGKRVATFLTKHLDIPLQNTVLWTDATTVLQWLATTEILSPFIQNRITEIRQGENILVRYVNTNENPADYASRGQSVPLLKRNNLWWNGPNWLTQEKLWPKPPLNVENFDSSIPRIQITTLVEAVRKNKSLLSENMEKNCKVFKTWSSRVRIFYHVIKFCFIGSKQAFYATETEATQIAERLLIIELQQKYFAKEIALIKKGENPRGDLGLFIDDKGVLRCKGRLHYAKFPWETKNPIYLPRESPIIFSLIKEIHERNHHIGVSHTLAKLRETYWISKGRSKVKSALHSCIRCRYWYGGSYPLPPIPPLPEARVTDVTPFLQIGIDSFGPLHIRNATDTIDVHVLIFTCLVTRAIHLELVPDLSGEQFLMALDRFCSLRRVPKLIISDNAKTFVFIQPMVGVKVHIKNHKVNQFITSNRIEWYFIPAYAPWFGGVYERLIGLIKKCLRIAYGRALITYMELQTVVYKIADIINSRPLTYISDEVVEPLTPNHFLKLGPTNVNLSLEPTPKPPLTATGKTLIEKWEVLTRILDSYWDAFRNLYLLSLRDIYKTHHKEKKGVSTFQPKVGDIVLIQEISMPRAYWEVGTIEKLDARQAVGFVRVHSNKKVVIRSIRHLFPLEIQREKASPGTSSSSAK